MDEKCMVDLSRDCLGLEKARMLEAQVTDLQLALAELYEKML